MSSPWSQAVTRTPCRAVRRSVHSMSQGVATPTTPTTSSRAGRRARHRTCSPRPASVMRLIGTATGWATARPTPRWTSSRLATPATPVAAGRPPWRPRRPACSARVPCTAPHCAHAGQAGPRPRPTADGSPPCPRPAGSAGSINQVAISVNGLEARGAQPRGPGRRARHDATRCNAVFESRAPFVPVMAQCLSASASARHEPARAAKQVRPDSSTGPPRPGPPPRPGTSLISLLGRSDPA